MTAEKMRSEVKHFWENNGQKHFCEEEEILLPTYARYANIDQEIFNEMLIEHVKNRALVAEVIETNEIVDAKVHQLGKDLEKHIRKEERIIFPLIQKELSEEVLETLAPYIYE